MLIRISLFLLLTQLFAAQSAVAQSKESPEVLATQASMQYGAGQFEEASTSYNKIIAQGHRSAALFYNLSVSDFRRGQIGTAVAAALAARYYDPTDPDLTNNLRYMLTKIDDKLGAEQIQPAWLSLVFWRNMMTMRAQFNWALAFLALALIWLGIWFLAQRKWMLSIIGALLAISLIFISGYFVRIKTTPVWSAVVVSEAPVYSAPNPEVAKTLFRLHEGAPFLIESQNDRWSRIRLSDGKVGWLASEMIGNYIRQGEAF